MPGAGRDVEHLPGTEECVPPSATWEPQQDWDALNGALLSHVYLNLWKVTCRLIFGKCLYLWICGKIHFYGSIEIMWLMDLWKVYIICEKWKGRGLFAFENGWRSGLLRNAYYPKQKPCIHPEVLFLTWGTCWGRAFEDLVGWCWRGEAKDEDRG